VAHTLRHEAPKETPGTYMTKKPTLPRAAFVLGVLILSLGVGLRQGSADPILGQRIYYEGGPVELKILQGDAYYKVKYTCSQAIRPI